MPGRGSRRHRPRCYRTTPGRDRRRLPLSLARSRQPAVSVRSPLARFVVTTVRVFWPASEQFYGHRHSELVGRQRATVRPWQATPSGAEIAFARTSASMTGPPARPPARRPAESASIGSRPAHFDGLLPSARPSAPAAQAAPTRHEVVRNSGVRPRGGVDCRGSCEPLRARAVLLPPAPRRTASAGRH